MLYDPELIDEKYLNLLGMDIKKVFDGNYLLNLYKKDRENLYQDKKFNDGRNKLKIDIIENYILYLFQKEEKTIGEAAILSLAQSFYTNLSVKDDIYYLNNKIFKNAHILGKGFFYNYDYIIEKQKNIMLAMKVLYDKYVGGNVLTDYDTTRLMEFLIGNISVLDYENCFENVLYRILNSDVELLMSEKNFLVQYIGFKKCRDSNIPPANIYISNCDLVSGKLFQKKSYIGIFYGNLNSLISLNELFYSNLCNRYIKKFSIKYFVKFIHTILHEVEHYKQSYFLKEKKLNPLSFAMIKTELFYDFLSDDDFKEYEENYEYKDIETQANIAAWKECIELFKKYNARRVLKDIDNCVKLNSDLAKEQAFAWQRSKDEDKTLIEKFNIVQLISIVNENPYVLDEYPQLKTFFDKDGRLKTFSVLLNEYTKLDIVKQTKENFQEISDIQECYYDVMNYYLIEKDINVLISDVNIEEDLITLFNLILKSLCLELDKLKDMKELIPNENDPVYDKFMQERKMRIRKYYKFIASNVKLLKYLDQYDKSNSRASRLSLYEILVNILNGRDMELLNHIDYMGGSNCLREGVRQYG